MDGVQALFIALSHGVAVFPDGRGGLTVSAIACDGIGDPTWIEMPE